MTPTHNLTSDQLRAQRYDYEDILERAENAEAELLRLKAAYDARMDRDAEGYLKSLVEVGERIRVLELCLRNEIAACMPCSGTGWIDIDKEQRVCVDCITMRKAMGMEPQ